MSEHPEGQGLDLLKPGGYNNENDYLKGSRTIGVNDRFEYKRETTLWNLDTLDYV